MNILKELLPMIACVIFGFFFGYWWTQMKLIGQRLDSISRKLDEILEEK